MREEERVTERGVERGEGERDIKSECSRRKKDRIISRRMK